jgi:signal transduction histidine kinase
MNLKNDRLKKNVLIVLLSCTFFCSSSICAQTVEEFKLKLNNQSLSVQERVDCLNLLSRELSYISPVESLTYATQALNLSLKVNYTNGQAYAYRSMASVYSYEGALAQTIVNVEKAMSIFRKGGDSIGVANCYVTLGHTYRRLEKHEEEIRYHRLSYDMILPTGQLERIAVVTHNYSEALLNGGYLDQSFELGKRAIVIADSLKILPLLSSCYKVNGKIYLKKQKTDSADYWFSKALVISRQLGRNSQKIATIESMLGKADILHLQDKHSEEEKLLLEIIKFIKELKMYSYVDLVYERLFQDLMSKSISTKGRKILEDYNMLKEQIENYQNEQKLGLITATQNIIRLEESNKELNDTMNIQKQLIRKEQQNRLVVTVFLIFICALLMVTILYYIRAKKSNNLLLQKEKIILENNKELDQLNKTKDKFFSIVSHDFVAPLGSIGSFSKLLVNNIGAISDKELKELGTELNKQVERTILFVQNLLAWSKMQMHKPDTKFEEIHLVEFFGYFLEFKHTLLKPKNITLVKNITPAVVSADKSQLEFILRNLISNAIKFTPVNGQISITTQKQDGFVKITIKDSGSGFSSSDLEKMKRGEFLVSKPGTNQEAGTGLGLVLCKEFALLNRATILVQNSSEGGAEVVLILPAAE